MKPLVLAIALNNNLVKKDEKFYLYNNGEKDENGYFPKSDYLIGKYHIKDSLKYKLNYFNYEDILTKSSTVGILQISQKLSSKQCIDGLKNFGFNTLGITNSYIKGLQSDKNNLIKATISYGQGIYVNFNQLLNAYSSINDIKIETVKTSVKNELKELLIKRVNYKRNYERKSPYNENIGIYTGTSQLIENNLYVKKYVPSSFGFYNKDNASYTIGVTVVNPDTKGDNWINGYSTYSSDLIFNEILKILQVEN